MLRESRPDARVSDITVRVRMHARAAIAALSTPEFVIAVLSGLSDEERAKVVLPLAEAMLRREDSCGVSDQTAILLREGDVVYSGRRVLGQGDTLLDAYRAAKGK